LAPPGTSGADGQQVWRQKVAVFSDRQLQIFVEQTH